MTTTLIDVVIGADTPLPRAYIGAAGKPIVKLGDLNLYVGHHANPSGYLRGMSDALLSLAADIDQAPRSTCPVSGCLNTNPHRIGLCAEVTA
jgi:hypothetical protein